MSLVSNTSRSSEYDVFLSFRGEDTRENFTAHLYKELCRKKIETYIDDVKLERGDEISPELLRAIQRSKISVVIFSKSYASSRWCLDELVQILDCRKRNGQIVVPVFYRVDPSHVRNLKGTYGTDFAELEKKYKFRMFNRVKGWRSALRVTANLSGFNWKNARTEADLVEDITRDILKKLRIYSSDIDGDKVGIEEGIQHIETLLSRGSQVINIIGIWGMGGIGKTTLAMTIFNRLSVEFEASCFLENVRERLERNGIDFLKSALYTELLNEGNSSFKPPYTSSTYVSDRLHLKKVFIVLDDVNEPYQVRNLVGDHTERFGQGSVIIVTSRNKQVLMNETTQENIYEVVALNDVEALRLFQMSAFRRNPSSFEDYMELSRRVIHYANGIPLALKVLGSLLIGKSKEEWESALGKLKRMPEKEIQRVLQISYDYLDRDEKVIFLDIACFFKGWDKDRVQDILDASGFSTLIGISNLISKSLVTVKDDNKLEMHDLIWDMGREVVREESVLGCTSRLLNDKDMWHILQDCTATKKVEGILVDLPHRNYDIIHHTCQGRCVNSESLSQMSNLRILIIYNTCPCYLYRSIALPSLPSAPSCFVWNGYPWKSLPSDFIVENLVELSLSGSQVKRLWGGVKFLPKLKYINVGYSHKLIEIPNLSRAPNLLIINLEYCSSLKSLYETRIFRSMWKNLKNLSKLPKNITNLCLRETSIKELPTTFEQLSVLEMLDLAHCKLLKCLPTSIYKLKSLKDLNLSGCSKLKTFPDILEPMEHLSVLNLSGTKIKDLPNSFYNLNNLQVLKIFGFSKLKKLPSYPGALYESIRCGCGSGCGSLINSSVIYLSSCTSQGIGARSRGRSYVQDWWEQCIVGLVEGKLSICVEFSFVKCLKCDKNACNDIIAKSELGILHMATILHEYYVFGTYKHIICLFGNEIPQRFDYQTEGSSINVEFALIQDKASLLGFIIGIVFELEAYCKFRRIDFKCNSYFKSNNNESYEVNSTLGVSVCHTTINSDHIFILFYDHLLHPSRGVCPAFPCSNLNEASFSVDTDPRQLTDNEIKHINVKKLGIWLLYAERARELGFIEEDIERCGDEQISSENMTEGNGGHPSRPLVQQIWERLSRCVAPNEVFPSA